MTQENPYLVELRTANARKTRAEASRRNWMNKHAEAITEANTLRLQLSELKARQEKAVRKATAQMLSSVSSEDLAFEVCRRLRVKKFMPGTLGEVANEISS